MLRVGIYVPITLNEQFINSIYFLTCSLDKFSGLTNYKVVFTVSRDGMTDLEYPSLNWAKGYPIEFHLCDEIVWTVHAKRAITENKPWFQYAATMKQQLANDFDEEDVVVFMDADTVVCGSLIEVVARAAQEGKILSPAPLGSRRASIWRAPYTSAAAPNAITVSNMQATAGRLWSHEPARLISISASSSCRAISPRLIRDNVSADVAFVEERFYDRYAAQTALCLLICRLQIRIWRLGRKV